MKAAIEAWLDKSNFVGGKQVKKLEEFRKLAWASSAVHADLAHGTGIQAVQIDLNSIMCYEAARFDSFQDACSIRWIFVVVGDRSIGTELKEVFLPCFESINTSLIMVRNFSSRGIFLELFICDQSSEAVIKWLWWLIDRFLWMQIYQETYHSRLFFCSWAFLSWRKKKRGDTGGK